MFAWGTCWVTGAADVGRVSCASMSPQAPRALCVPKRPATHGQSRPHAASAHRMIIPRNTGNWPYQVDSQADSAGSIPVTRSTREKCCSTSEFDCISQAGQRSFASETALVPLRVPLAILASAPGDCQFPS
jgi:hypothetical protein